jgi:hypothetical protein
LISSTQRAMAANGPAPPLIRDEQAFRNHGETAAFTAGRRTVEAVHDMQARAAVLAARQRDHAPKAQHPFVVVLVDEVTLLGCARSRARRAARHSL